MAIKRDKILKNAEKLVQKGKLDQAIREYEKLLQASPNDTNTVNRLGDLYGRVGEIDKAVALYEQVAEGFAGQGFVPKAIAIYKKINRLAPQRLDIFERLGEPLRRTGPHGRGEKPVPNAGRTLRQERRHGERPPRSRTSGRNRSERLHIEAEVRRHAA